MQVVRYDVYATVNAINREIYRITSKYMKSVLIPLFNFIRLMHCIGYYLGMYSVHFNLVYTFGFNGLLSLTDTRSPLLVLNRGFTVYSCARII